MDTTIYPNNGVSGTPFVHTGGDSHHGLHELMTNNNITDNGRAILTTTHIYPEGILKQLAL